MDSENYKEGQSMQRPVLEKDSEASKSKKEKYNLLALKAKKVSSDKEASCLDSDDEEYAIAVMDFKKFFKIRIKFICQPYDDKKTLRKAKDEKKGNEYRRCFKCGDPNHFISYCPKHSYNDQKAFIGGCWSDSDEVDDPKKDEICLMAHDSNEGTISADDTSKPILKNRSEFVQVIKKTSPSATVGNVKQTPSLKLGQGIGKSKIQTRPKMPPRRLVCV
ncbi:zf-CCHC domain-containing protein [Tanacetum coccineum]